MKGKHFLPHYKFPDMKLSTKIHGLHTKK